MKKFTFLLFLISLPICFSSFAQEKKASLEDLNFLTGFWVGDGFGGVSEEMWSPLSGGRITGTYKHIMDDKTTFMEYLDISMVNDTIKLRLKHFSSDFVGWEEKEDNVSFALLSTSPNKAVFKGLTYELISEDRLKITLAMKDKEGKVNFEIFNMKKINL